MAVTSYSAVSWQPSEIITDEKMSQFSDNVQWVKDNTPRSYYATTSGLKRSNGIVILGGIALITPREQSFATVNVNFGSTFATGCEPVITTGIVNGFQTRVFCRLAGRGRVKPDHTGFEATVQVAANIAENNKILNNIYVHYQALGYK